MYRQLTSRLSDQKPKVHLNHLWKVSKELSVAAKHMSKLTRFGKETNAECIWTVGKAVEHDYCHYCNGKSPATKE